MTGTTPSSGSSGPVTECSCDGAGLCNACYACPICADTGSIEQITGRDKFGVYDTQTFDCPHCTPTTKADA